MATVPPTRLASPPAPGLPIPIAPRRFRLPAALVRLSNYSILLSVVYPTAGIALGIATLRAGADVAGRRRATAAITVGVAAWVGYAILMIVMVGVCISLLSRLAALGAFS